jgi:ribosomal protein L29
MRRNDVTQLRSLDTAELTKKASEFRKNLEVARTDKVMGRLKNVKLIETLRRDIARVETALAAKGK